MAVGQEMIETADELEQFERQVDQMLHAAAFPHAHYRMRAWRPPMDVFETEDAIIVKIEIAGMSPYDFSISFLDRVLTVQGSRQDVDAKLTYHRLEIPYGDFHVEVFLPGTYMANQIEARYENGFLYITLPKSTEEHRVPIRVQTQ